MNLIGEHLSKSYDQDLQNLVNLFLKMGGMAEANLTKAIESLVKSDVALAEDVIDGDKEINLLSSSLMIRWSKYWHVVNLLLPTYA